MYDWFLTLGPEQWAALGGGAGMFLAAFYTAWRGRKAGRPTSGAALAAVQAANCRIPDLTPVFAQARADIAAARAAQAEGVEAIRDDLREIAVTLARIDGRTERGR